MSWRCCLSPITRFHFFRKGVYFAEVLLIVTSLFFSKNCFKYIELISCAKDELSTQNCWNYCEVEQKTINKQTTKQKKLVTNWFSMLKDFWLKKKSLSWWQFKCSHQQLLITFYEKHPLDFCPGQSRPLICHALPVYYSQYKNQAFESSWEFFLVLTERLIEALQVFHKMLY